MSTLSSTAPASPATLAEIPRLGVGVLYNPSLAGFLRSDLELLDYVAVIPDRFWTDRGPGHPARFEEIGAWMRVLEHVAERRPLVSHSVGMSIGSAEWFDTEHLEQLARWNRRFGFPWHSDHLSFARVAGEDAHSVATGMACPIPYDREVLEMVAERVERVMRTVPTPFLLENNVYYVDLPEQEMTEPEFLNRLAERTGCGLLLDVHNVYVNSVNHGFDPAAFVDALELDRVVEVHIAGGSEMLGMYTDSHAGPCPEPVWELLDRVVAGAPNLCGITFEFEETYFPRLGVEGVCEQVRRARAAWDRAR